MTVPLPLDFDRPALDTWLERQEGGLAAGVAELVAHDPIGEPNDAMSAGLHRLAMALSETAAAPDRDRRLARLGEVGALERLGRLLAALDATRRVRLLRHLHEELGEAGQLVLRRLLQRHSVGSVDGNAEGDVIRATVEHLYRRALLLRLLDPERVTLLQAALADASHA